MICRIFMKNIRKILVIFGKTWVGIKVPNGYTTKTDIISAVVNKTETSELDPSFDDIYDNVDVLGDVDFKSDEDNVLQVFDENKSSEEGERLDPRHLPTPDDELSQKDVLWDPKNLETADDGGSESEV